MANERIMNSRLQQKHDIEANWLKAVNFIPKDGEIIVYDAEIQGNEIPSYRVELIEYARVKIGDGATNVNDLPFLKGVGMSTAEGGEIFCDYDNNKAGLKAHAEGHSTQALAPYSHAEGQGTITSTSLSGQHVQGKWNNPSDVEDYAHIVGWGSNNTPKNIHTLKTDGEAWFAKDIYIGNERNKVITTPQNASIGDLLMYNGTEWVSLSKADLITEIIAALPSAEEASF